MHIVKCVKKGSEIKVVVVGQEGNVQFPKDIREDGKMFVVENLEKVKSFWKASGQIYECVPINAEPKTKTQSKDYDYVEFVEVNDNEGETWSFFVKKDSKNLKELMAVFDRYKELDDEEMSTYSYNLVSQKTVDVCLKRKSKTNYLSEYNLSKIVDSKSIDKKFTSYNDVKTLDDINDVLYKGSCFNR